MHRRFPTAVDETLKPTYDSRPIAHIVEVDVTSFELNCERATLCCSYQSKAVCNLVKS